MNLSWKESLLQFWFIFLASLFSFNFQFFFIKALSCYHYPSYPLKIMKENSYSGNMDISQEIKRNSFCNNILFSIRFQTSRPLGRNCRRTLLTQLTDRFYWWTLFPMESSPINIVSPVWVPDYYQVNSHQNKERHKITIQAWMVNRCNPKSSYERILMAPPCRLFSCLDRITIGLTGNSVISTLKWTVYCQQVFNL